MLLRRLRFALPLALSVLLVDCATKELAVTALSPEHTPHAVVGDVVRLTLAYNPHAAMGLPLGRYSRWPLVALGVAITLVLVRMLWLTPPAATRAADCTRVGTWWSNRERGQQSTHAPRCRRLY